MGTASTAMGGYQFRPRNDIHNRGVVARFLFPNQPVTLVLMWGYPGLERGCAGQSKRSTRLLLPFEHLSFQHDVGKSFFDRVHKMDESMSTDSSFTGPSRGVGAVGIGISNPARPFPAVFPNPVAAYAQPQQGQAERMGRDPWAAHRAHGEGPQSQQGIQYDQASPEQGGISEEQEEEEEGEEQGEEDEEMSEGSSADYDAEADPEGWAKRLDELAGVLEISEEEARAVRWGPALGPDRDSEHLTPRSLPSPPRPGCLVFGQSF